MELKLYNQFDRLIGPDSVLDIVANDLMFNPRGDAPDELSFVLKFSGLHKNWPTRIVVDDKMEYFFDGQDVLPRDWAGHYCGGATFVQRHFKMEHLHFDHTEMFTNNTAPDWLTSKRTVPGSTMDQRWFWKEHVLTLRVGEHVNTDWRRITRIK